MNNNYPVKVGGLDSFDAFLTSFPEAASAARQGVAFMTPPRDVFSAVPAIDFERKRGSAMGIDEPAVASRPKM